MLPRCPPLEPTLIYTHRVCSELDRTPAFSPLVQFLGPLWMFGEETGHLNAACRSETWNSNTVQGTLKCCCCSRLTGWVLLLDTFEAEMDQARSTISKIVSMAYTKLLLIA